MDIDYAALGQTEAEAALLAEHDRNETLHEYVSETGFPGGLCHECADTAEGLMHNNTRRNVEPLLQPHTFDPLDDGVTPPLCQECGQAEHSDDIRANHV